MKLLDLIEQISEFKSANFTELDKLELSEVERYIRKLDNLKTALEHKRSRLLNKPVVKDEFYTVKDAGTRLNVTGQMIYNLTSAGKLKHTKIGNKILISEQDIKDYLNQNKKG